MSSTSTHDRFVTIAKETVVGAGGRVITTLPGWELILIAEDTQPDIATSELQCDSSIRPVCVPGAMA